MPENITGLGTTFNLPQYAGELFTADTAQAPLLSMIGGLTGGKQTDNFEFPTSVVYDLPTPEQPAISEQASATAPTATAITKSQETNVVQIHQETIDITYAKQSNSGRMSGLNTAGQQPNPAQEKAFQIAQRLKKITRDVEFSFISGSYQKATAADVANKTRGMIELCDNKNHIDLGGRDLTKAKLQELFREMARNGAFFGNMVIYAGAYVKQMLSEIYGLDKGFALPPTRNVGGVNINEIETDFCKAGISWSRFVPEGALLLADVSAIAPVFQPVPEKGNFFEEALAKVGASDRIQIYGQVGLAHGPAFLHGLITGIGTDVTLRLLNVSSAAGSTSGTSKITVSSVPDEGNSFVYKTLSTSAPVVAYDDVLTSGWASLPANGEITVADGQKITVAEVTSSNKARKSGSAVIVSAT